jgi:ribosomal protein L29
VKIKTFVEDLKAKSVAELNEELVAAKGTLQSEIPERNKSVR